MLTSGFSSLFHSALFQRHTVSLFCPPPRNRSSARAAMPLQQTTSAGSKLIREAAKRIPAVVNKCKYIFISNRFPLYRAAQSPALLPSLQTAPSARGNGVVGSNLGRLRPDAESHGHDVFNERRFFRSVVADNCRAFAYF